MKVWEEILALYAEGGRAAYFGEAVSMTEHGLQAAHFAAQSNAPDALILAALLHDVGHLIETVPADIADWQTDAQHEISGSRFLAARFGAAIADPVRLHVPAKRYLCAVEPAYLRDLSAASVVTLKLQGGAMSADEVKTFSLQPQHHDAVLVRRCDDRGKIANLKVPALGDYRALIEGFARACRSARQGRGWA